MHSLYVWMPPNVWGYPNIQGASKHTGGMYAPMFGCTLNIHNTKKACFVRLRGIHMPPYIWITPICFDAFPVCLDAPKCRGASKDMGMSKHRGGIQIYGGMETYRGIPICRRHLNIRGIKAYGGVQRYGGCPNIQGVSQT